MAIAKSRITSRRKPVSLRGQRLIAKRFIPKKAIQQSKAIAKQSVQQSKPTVNYEAAWKDAMTHFDKGMAGSYLYFMRKEAREDPQIGAIYAYVKELDKQRRAGNISPTNAKEGILSKIRRNPELEYQKRLDAVAEYKKIHPSSTYQAQPVLSQVDRKSILSDIHKNKIKGVRVSGGRLFDSSTGNPISYVSAYNRGIVKNVQDGLLRGEKLLYDINYNIIGIESSALQQTIPFTESNIKSYNKRIINTPAGKQAAIVNLFTKKIPTKDIFKTVKKTEAQKLASKVNIKKSSDPNKLIVQFPNGQKGTINASGTVIVGAKLAGKKYTFKDGIIIAVDGKSTFAREEFVTAPTAIKPEEREIKTKVELAEKKAIKFLKDKSKKWEQDISTTKGILTNANRRGDLDKLRELQQLGKQRTPSQTIEYNKLKKQTARNYELGGELIGKIIGTSLINMGVGSAELLKALNENPKETLIALPPAIYAGVKQDFNRVMGGDPLEIASIPLEWYTFGKLAGVFSKGAKASVGIGRSLSPKYFTGIATKIGIPPTTLRRVAIKTATGRAAEKAVKNALKKSGVSKKVATFNKNVKAGKANVDRKLDSISRSASMVKKKTTKIISNLESRTNVNKQYKRAKQNFKKSMDKKAAITVGNDDYIKSVVFLEGLSANISKVSAKKFLRDFKAKGGKIGLGQEEQFIKAVQNHAKKNLNSLSAFKELKNTAKLKKSFQVNLRKKGKIETAKIIFKKLKVKIGKLSLVKRMNSTIKKLSAKGREVKRGVRKGVRKVGKGAGQIKKKSKEITANLESRVNLNNQFMRARRNIKKSLGSGVKTITVGNTEYIKAVAFIEQFSSNVAKVSAKKFLRDFKAKGGKIGLGQEEQFIKAVQKKFKNTLDNTPSFKKLKEAARLKKPFQIKLARKNKLVSAKRLTKNLVGKVKSTKAVSGMTSIIKKVSSKVSRVKRKVSPKRIKKRIKRKIEVIKERRMIKKTIRYRMEQARPIRKVTFDKLKRSQKVSDMNKFIDTFSNEMGRRQKIDIKAVNFLQMKNVLKKRMKRAINSGNLPEINKFRIEIGKLLSNMNKKASNPDIKIIKTTGKDRRIRTIKDFESKSPKGTYREVKVGNQVMMQEVKQAKRVKQVQAMEQPIQKYKIVSVQKKAINLKPLLEFGVKSLSATAIKNILKSKQVFGKISNQGQLVKVLQDSAQDFKVLQVVGQGMNVNVASAILSAVNSKTRVRPRLRTKQITKQKKKVVSKPRLKKPKITRTLSKKVMTYGFIIKKGGRQVKIKIPPMTLKDAWDVGSKKLDFDLQRTGKLIPVGMTNEVAIIPKSVKGYYGRNSKKFRRFRKKKGKRFTLERTIIEKRKYVGDTASEKRQLKAARRKKKSTKRKISTKKKRKTIKSLK